MSEQLTERIERLEFNTVKPGDVIHITTGIGDEAWRYEFTVSDASTIWPDGTLKATSPDGSESEPAPFALHGCGRWTNHGKTPYKPKKERLLHTTKGLLSVVSYGVSHQSLSSD